MKTNPIKSLRSDLQDLDEEIIRLLNKRANVCLEIGRVKNDRGMDVYDPSQEARVYNRLRDVNQGPLPNHHLRNIFREIISTSRALQAPVSVAFLGPEASFTHLAVLANFGRGVQTSPQSTIADVFEEVERYKAHWGIVPVENSTEGPVKSTLDRLITTPLNIRGEVFVRVSHSLVSMGSKKKAIKRVFSQPPGPCPVPGMAAKESSKGDSHRHGTVRPQQPKRSWTIPKTRLSAAAWPRNITASISWEDGIEDHPLNTTRFLVIGYGAGEATGSDKTSILFGTPHTPGALFHALEGFAKAGINLIRIALLSHPGPAVGVSLLCRYDGALRGAGHKKMPCRNGK